MLFYVQKMTCNHCVRSVTQAVHALDPAARVEVNLAEGTVRVDGVHDTAAVVRAIEAEGYTVSIKESGKRQ